MKRRTPILILILTMLLIPGLRALASPFAPISTRPQREAAVDKDLAWIHAQQQANGAVGGLGESCDIARAVALAGDDPDDPTWTPGRVSLLKRCKLDLPEYLAREDAGRIAKVLRAAIATDEDPQDFGGYDLIAMLESQYDPQTGFYHPHNLFRNALAMIALEEAERPISAKTIAAIANEQNSDGCWGWPIGGDVTDTDTSGLIIHALAGAGYADHPAAVQCVGTLMARQLPDASWEARWGDAAGNSDSTALVIQGLAAAGWDPEGPAFTKDRTAVEALLAFQAEDGSFWWRYDQAGTLLLGSKQAIQPLVMTYPNERPKPFTLYLPVSAH